MDIDLDDLSELQNIAAPRRRRRAAKAAAAPAAVPIAAAPGAVPIADAAPAAAAPAGDLELAILVAGQEAPEYGQRSRALLRAARAQYSLNCANRRAATESDKRQRLQLVVDGTAEAFPIVASAMGLRPTRGFTETRAIALQRLATGSQFRGTQVNKFQKTQVVSAPFIVQHHSIKSLRESRQPRHEESEIARRWFRPCIE